MVLSPGDKRSALAKIPKEYRDYCDSIESPIKALDGISVQHVEGSYAYHIPSQESRWIGDNLNRAYPVLAVAEIAGTADVLGKTSDGLPVFLDWKTSFDIGELPNYSQFRFFACCLGNDIASTIRRDKILGRVGYVRQSGSIECDEHYYTLDEIMEYGRVLEGLYWRLVDASELVQGGGFIETSSGPWCRYCPSVTHCPSQTAIARNILGELTEVATQVREMTDEEATRVLFKTFSIRDLLERIELALDDRAVSIPIPTSNGKVYTETMSNRHRLDKKSVLKLLEKYQVPKQEIDSCFKSFDFPVMREVKERS